MGLAPGLAAQDELIVRVQGGEGWSVPISFDRGYGAVPASSASRLGWEVVANDRSWSLRRAPARTGEDGSLEAKGADLEVFAGSVLFRWDADWLQWVAPPYETGGDLFLPLQLFTDFFPARLPDRFGFSAGRNRLVLEVLAPAWDPSPESGNGSQGLLEARTGVVVGADEPVRETRVVIIDPGHGGRDLGALGPGGTREKDVALAVGLALAKELREDSSLEVHLTRDEDVLIPLWERGQWATNIKQDRYGVFISLHANALPNQPSATGFESYFLSEARTEHDERVAAIENAPLGIESEGDGASADPGLEFILKELRNLDHQHWSALFAEMIQNRIEPVHAGPDRGVKQGPFAVLTNALMPAVLVEMGFISNRSEERVLRSDGFHEDVARALAQAVHDFFERYPPGQETRTPPGQETHTPTEVDSGTGR